jgi:hypothetical protein
MKGKSLVALSVLLLASAPAFAKDQNIAAVQVRPQPHALEMSCASPVASAVDVERVLAIRDRSTTATLRDELAGAVGEACNAGVTSIAVQRSATGHSVTWTPAREGYASIALNSP